MKNERTRWGKRNVWRPPWDISKRSWQKKRIAVNIRQGVEASEIEKSKKERESRGERGSFGPRAPILFGCKRAAVSAHRFATALTVALVKTSPGSFANRQQTHCLSIVAPTGHPLRLTRWCLLYSYSRARIPIWCSNPFSLWKSFSSHRNWFVKKYETKKNEKKKIPRNKSSESFTRAF